MNLTREQAQERVKELAILAKGSNNLHIIFGNNGLSGRSATGNYTLIATAIEMSRKHIGTVLRGKTTPSYSTLLRLSEVTGIGISEISRYIEQQKQKDRRAA